MPKNELTEAEAKELNEYLQAAEELQKKNPMPKLKLDNIEEDVTLWNQVNEWAAVWKELNDKYRPLLEKAVNIGLGKLDEASGGATSFDIMRLALPEVNPELSTAISDLSKFGLMNDKINRTLIKDKPKKGKREGKLYSVWEVNQAPAGKKEVITRVSLSNISDDISYTTNRTVSAYDDAVFCTACNTVYSATLANINFPIFVSTNELWRRMNGITDTRVTPSPQQKKQFVKGMDNCRNTNLRMNMKAEAAAGYKLPDGDEIAGKIYEGAYLPASKTTIYTKNHKVIEGYEFNELPYLYRYNLSKGHIVLIDPKLLHTSDERKETENTVEFKFYLLREIQLMYDHRRASNRILYQTMYEATGIEPPETRIKEEKYKNKNSYLSNVRSQGKQDREIVFSLLNAWINEDKWILGYDQVKKGQKYVGIDIILNPEKFTVSDSQKEIEGK